jgi:hypothetical protein
MNMKSQAGMILRGEKRRARRKTYPSATLPRTNPTLTNPGANPNRRGEMSATNFLSHVTAPPRLEALLEMMFIKQNNYHMSLSRKQFKKKNRFKEVSVLRNMKSHMRLNQVITAYVPTL